MLNKTKEANNMTEKQWQVLEQIGKLMNSMSDGELEKLLLIGEGMAIMADIKEKREATQKSA